MECEFVSVRTTQQVFSEYGGKKKKRSQKLLKGTFRKAHAGVDKVSDGVAGVSPPSWNSVVVSVSIQVTCMASIFGFDGLSCIFTAVGINLLVGAALNVAAVVFGHLGIKHGQKRPRYRQTIPALVKRQRGADRLSEGILANSQNC